MSLLPKKVHIVGICGVATSALAIALKDQGCLVSGSDKGFFPPVSNHLTNAGITYYAGWHPENIGNPDIVIAGGAGTSLANPELIYAKENNLPILSFAQALGKYIVKNNSIVVTGTWGKTTISSLLSYILIQAGKNPSYFTGGLSLSHKTGAITDSEWSVVEGDEYQSAIWDKQAKFVYYSPTHLLLTSVSWDHADLYPTEKSYFDAFRKLILNIPNHGLLVYCADDKGIKLCLDDLDLEGSGISKTQRINYGREISANYQYHSILYTKNGLNFKIKHLNQEWNIISPMLGRFNVENITATFAMAHSIGIEANIIIDSIQKFIGIKRRLEKRLDGKITVFDCLAPTAEKAGSVLQSIREVYDKKIYAVYEPNIGGRQNASIHLYDNAFKNADIVIIPRLTKLKISETETDQPIEGIDLKNVISKTHNNSVYFENDDELINFIVSNTKNGDVIVFLGSHGFRGMIEETIEKLS